MSNASIMKESRSQDRSENQDEEISKYDIEKLDKELETAKQRMEKAWEEAEKYNEVVTSTREHLKQLLNVRKEREDEYIRNMIAKNRQLTEDLELEQRASQQAVEVRKKLEQQLLEINEKLDVSQRQGDEMSRQLREIQHAFKESQMEAQEARSAMDDAIAGQRDAEKRVRNTEDEIKRLNAEVQAISSSKRKIEAERDELLEEMTTLRQSGLGGEEKRRFEATIADMRQQLLDDGLFSTHQINTMISANIVCRLRTQLSVAEANFSSLEQQISVEEQDRLRYSRGGESQEDAEVQTMSRKRCADRNPVHDKIKEAKRAEDLKEANETLTKDVSLLKQRDSASRRTPSMFHRESRRFGSNSSIATRDDYRNGVALSMEMSPIDRPESRMTSGTGSQPGNTDEDAESIRN